MAKLLAEKNKDVIITENEKSRYNKETEKAIKEAKSGIGLIEAESVDELFEKLKSRCTKLLLRIGLKKDFKKSLKRGLKEDLLKEVVLLLGNKGKLPSKYKPHKLSGNYVGT